MFRDAFRIFETDFSLTTSNVERKRALLWPITIESTIYHYFSLIAVRLIDQIISRVLTRFFCIQKHKHRVLSDGKI